MNRLIDADVLIEKAHQESKGMSYPYREDFGLLVEWIVDKTPAVQPQQTCEYWDSESKFCALCRPAAQPEKRTEEHTETHACDLIDRQALMKEFTDFVRASNNSDFERTPIWNDAVSLVGSMPSAQPERWIPVTERLPEENGLYLVTEIGHWVYPVETRYFNVREDGGFWSGHPGDKVLAWMPLPEPWKENNDEG